MTMMFVNTRRVSTNSPKQSGQKLYSRTNNWVKVKRVKTIENSSALQYAHNAELKQKNEKKALRETQTQYTARALAVLRFGHHPPAVTNPQTARTCAAAS